MRPEILLVSQHGLTVCEYLLPRQSGTPYAHCEEVAEDIV